MVLGRTTSGGLLLITKPGTLVEKTRSDSIIHCECGKRIVQTCDVKVVVQQLTIQRSR
jgi:hypothetical protein